MVIDAVEPTLPVLPCPPLTVEVQAPPAQPSARTAAGTSDSVTRTTSAT
ncbi:MAG TPA: hypothetical protein VF366_03700 [Dehalococcoidia bacterium]